MSYCIEYNPELKKKYPKAKFTKQISIKPIIYILVCFVATYLFVESKIYRYLLPGNPDVTIAAFSTLVERVGEGDPMGAAVRSFCEEIILNGMK